MARKFQKTELEKIRVTCAILPQATSQEMEADDLTEEEFVDAVRRLK